MARLGHAQLRRAVLDVDGKSAGKLAEAQVLFETILRLRPSFDHVRILWAHALAEPDRLSRAAARLPRTAPPPPERRNSPGARRGPQPRSAAAGRAGRNSRATNRRGPPCDPAGHRCQGRSAT